MSKQRTVRVSEQTHQYIVDLANESGEPMTSIIEQAVERYRREQLLRKANADWTKVNKFDVRVDDEVGQRLARNVEELAAKMGKTVEDRYLIII